jgi:uncharacterized protein (TIGR04255 family)
MLPTPPAVPRKVPKASRPPGLPDFANPPIDEVVMSIQFASLARLRGPHVGLFWKTIRSRYPDVTEHPPIQAAFETFGTPSTQTLPSIQFSLAPPTPRFWFDKGGGPDLLQLQQDRIIHNWRKREKDQIYPRYETVRRQFQSEVAMFSKFLAAEQLGEIRPNQCEVTYINIIEFPEGSDPQSKLQDITPLWSTQLDADLPGEFENALVQAQFLLSNGHNAEPIGRIYVNFQPAVRQSDLTPVVRLEITARAKPPSETIDDAYKLLDDERSAVVRTFAAVTTPKMHHVWGRKDARR